jgi:hypothetical protein
MTIVMQRPGADNLYVSDLIAGRFQVLESSTNRNYFYIYDHTKEENQRNRDGSTMYFTNPADATAHVVEAFNHVKHTKEPKPAKEPKTTETKEPKPAKEPKATESKPKKGSAHGTMVELIRTTQMTDDEIAAEAARLFPDCKICTPYGVKYRRRRVEANII